MQPGSRTSSMPTLRHDLNMSDRSGHVNSTPIRDLKGTIERKGAEIGLFITLDERAIARDRLTTYGYTFLD
jgi:hypothetical protein